MDAFDKALPTLGKNTAKLRELCICPQCPTYNSCAGDAKELLYCVYGISFRCLTEDLGCICPTCPVVDKIGLVQLTFCLLGSEATQRYGKNLSGNTKSLSD